MKTRFSFKYFLTLFVVTTALWFILSEIFEAKFIVYGLLSALVISALTYPVLFAEGAKTGRPYFLMQVHPIRFAVYFLWLVKEIIKSAVSVSGNILRGNGSLQSQIVYFRADYDNPAARTLLANSITLTPGTVTIDIFDDGTFSVHALADSYAKGLLDGTMQRKVAGVFGEEIDYKALTAKEVEGV